MQDGGSIKKHFDEIAPVYDEYKRKNSYYYSSLKTLLEQKIKTGTKILEIGCGTGDLLSSINPKFGVGIDISPEMINIARKKHPQKNLSFYAQEAENLKIKGNFDYVFLVDVIEHLYDVDKTVKEMKRVSHSKTKIIISSANPKWEPILHLLEKLNLKMPEGPHNWINLQSLKKILNDNGFSVIEEGYRLLVPKKIPMFSESVNSLFYKTPILKNFGLIQFLVCRPTKDF